MSAIKPRIQHDPYAAWIGQCQCDACINNREEPPEEEEPQGRRTDSFTIHELRLLTSAARHFQFKALLAEFQAALDERIKERLKGEDK